jgi:hypothetical protein
MRVLFLYINLNVLYNVFKIEIKMQIYSSLSTDDSIQVFEGSVLV